MPQGRGGRGGGRRGENGGVVAQGDGVPSALGVLAVPALRLLPARPPCPGRVGGVRGLGRLRSSPLSVLALTGSLRSGTG